MLMVYVKQLQTIKTTNAAANYYYLCPLCQ